MDSTVGSHSKKVITCYDVSVIIPIYNGEKWIDNCFSSILKQSAKDVLSLEVCVCNDASTDNTETLLERWKDKFNSNKISLKICKNISGSPMGVGCGKNRAVQICSGTYLCFQDIDDIMLPDRILFQYEQARTLPNNVLIGSRFERDPPDSTSRYTRWANSLTQSQLICQIYNSHGPTVIMPTWFCHKDVFTRVGGFCEDGKGTPEDLIFFYKHLDTGGTVARNDAVLVLYRYHPEATTFSILEETIWNIRIQRIQEKVLTKWTQFTIWNAGKQGRKFYKSLSPENRNKVVAFCDVNKNKVGKHYESYNESERRVDQKIKMIHFTHATPPFVICVKLDMTGGQFEENLNSLNLKEDVDFVYFN